MVIMFCDIKNVLVSCKHKNHVDKANQQESNARPY